jgi:DNA repair exonuclease SbcCD ATPase subunit
MIFKELIIKNFKKIDELKINFENGINLIHGRNEAGKSSIIEAISNVFLTDPVLSNKKILKLVPWNTDVKPYVKIKFINSINEVYIIEKIFNKGSGKLFFIANNKEKLIAEGSKIQDKIFEKIGISGELESLIRLLWIDQGEILNIFNENIPHEATAYIKDIIKENVISRELEIFYGNLKSKHDEYIDKRNDEIKKTSLLFKLNEEYKMIETELNHVKQQLNVLESNINILSQLNISNDNLLLEIKNKEKYLNNMEIKKKKIDELKNKEYEFASVKKDYLDFLRNNEDIAAKTTDLSIYCAHKKYCLTKKIKQISDKEKIFNDTKLELEKINRLLKAIKYVDESLIEEYESLKDKAFHINAQLDNTGIEIKIKPYKKIEAAIKIDDENKNITLEEDIIYNTNNFFSIDYPDNFKLEVLNSSQNNFNNANLKKELDIINKRINELIKMFGKDDIKSIKSDNKKYIELNNHKMILLERLKNEEMERISENKKSIMEEISMLSEYKELNKNEIDKVEKNQPLENYLVFLDKQIDKLNIFIENCSNANKNILSNYKNIDDLKSKYLLQKEQIDSLKNDIVSLKPEHLVNITERDINDARLEIENLKKRINENMMESAKINTRLENYYALQDESAKYQSKLEDIKTKLNNEKNNLNAIKLLLHLIDKEKKDLKDKVLYPLEKKVLKAFSKVTENKYTNISINENFKLSSINANALTGDSSVNHEILSYGTKEQLAFLFRLAIADFLSEKDTQVMILDDSFVNTDEHRLNIIMDMIKSYSGKIQFLIFTCKDDYDNFKNDVNWIDLDKILT